MAGGKQLFKIQEENSSTTPNQHEILEQVKEFYSSLYGDTADQVALDDVEKTDVPIVLLDVVRSSMQNLKNGKAAGQDALAGEILKSCDSEIHRLWLIYLLNALRKKIYQHHGKMLKSYFSIRKEIKNI